MRYLTYILNNKLGSLGQHTKTAIQLRIHSRFCHFWHLNLGKLFGDSTQNKAFWTHIVTRNVLSNVVFALIRVFGIKRADIGNAQNWERIHDWIQCEDIWMEQTIIQLKNIKYVSSHRNKCKTELPWGAVRQKNAYFYLSLQQLLYVLLCLICVWV